MSNRVLLKNSFSVISSFSKMLFSIPLCFLLIALCCNSTSAVEEEKQKLLVNSAADDLERGVVVHRRPTPVTQYGTIPTTQYEERILLEVNPEVAQKQWSTISDLVTLVCDKRYYKKIFPKYKDTVPEDSINSVEKLIDYLKPRAFTILTQEPLFSTYQQALRLQTVDLIKAIKEFIKSDDLLRAQNTSLLRDINIYLEDLAEKDRQLVEKDKTIEELRISRNCWRGSTALGMVSIVGAVFLTHYFWRY